jgi:hypothetical protein
MNERCTFKQGRFNCGSYAFNLYKENIEQGDYCDHHYWQDQAMKAAAQEREECAKLCDEVGKESASHWPYRFANMIRARGTT